MKVNSLFFFIILTFLISCDQQDMYMAPAEYVKWTTSEESGWRKEVKTGAYKFILQFRSPELLALNNLCTDPNCDVRAAQLDSVAKKYDSLLFFRFDILGSNNESFLNHNASSESEVYARINYFVSHAQADFQLFSDADTVSSVLYHFEQTYGASPYNSISLAFPIPSNKEKDITFIYNDRALNSGKVKFQLKANKIFKRPIIKTRV